jgi:hypothetical protein
MGQLFQIAWGLGAFLALLATANLPACAAPLPMAKGKPFRINYLSKDFVYLKAGRQAGLDKGDTLEIQREEKRIAILAVEFAADYSSSCRILSQKGNIILGDVAFLKAKSATDPALEASPTDTLVSRVRELPRIHVQGEVAQAFARTRGNMAYQMYVEKGFANERVSLSRQNVRMNLRMSELAGRHFSLQMDMYATQRNSLFSGAEQNRNWDNRVNQFAFAYDNPAGKLTYEIGRVIPEGISSIGYIDGGAFKLQATQAQSIGGFGGQIPRMLYYEAPIATEKYGGFYGLNFKMGENSSLDNLAGFGGEYDGTVISREFINLKNSLYLGRSLSLSQTSEIEVNRDWRREKAEHDFSLSSLYVNANWKASKIFSFGVQYDTRQNFYRLNTRTLADSLFDHATRMGLKENMSIRFLPTASLYLGFGHSQMSDEKDTPYNYSIGLNVDNLVWKRLALNSYYTGFEASTNQGYNGSLYLRRSFLNGNDLSFGYGRYQYRYSNDAASAIQSDWLRVGGTVQLPFKTYFTTDYEYNWGDSESGHRGLLELGYWL